MNDYPTEVTKANKRVGVGPGSTMSRSLVGGYDQSAPGGGLPPGIGGTGE